MTIQERQPTDVEQRRIFEQFARQRKMIVFLAADMALLVAIVLALFFTGIAPPTIAVGLLLASFGFGAVVNLRLWRCPHCKQHLGKLYFGISEPRFCPHCAVPLIER